MLRADEELFYLVTIPDFHDISPTTHALNGASASVEAFVRHAFVDARIYYDMNLLPNLKLLNRSAYLR